MKRVIYWLLMLISTGGNAWALSHTQGPDTYSGNQYTTNVSISVTRPDAEHYSYLMTVQVTASATGFSHSGEGKIQLAHDDAGTNAAFGVSHIVNLSSAQTENSANFEVTNAVLSSSYTHMRLYVNNTGLSSGYSSPWVPITSVPEPDYTITFRIPQNPTAYPVVYKFYQGDTLITSYTQSPGAAATTIDLNGLTSDEDVFMVEYTGSLSRSEGGGVVFTPDTNWQVVNTGQPVTEGSTPIDGAPKPIGPPLVTAAPAVPSPVTPTPAPTPTTPLPAPTPAAAPTVPSAQPNPYTPTGTGGATKADLEDAINKLVADANATRTADTNNAAAVVTALNTLSANAATNANKVVEAVDTNTAKNVDALAKVVTASNNVSTSIGIANQHLFNILNTERSTQALTAGQYELMTAEEKRRTDDQVARASAVATAGPEGTTAAAALETAMAAADVNNRVQNIGGTATGDGTFLLWETPIGTFDFDPMHDAQMTTFVTWLKAAIAWMIVILFEWFVWSEFRDVLRGAFNAVPAKGNPVAGGTGAQVTSLIVATAITAVLISLPTVYWAAIDSGIASWVVNLADDPINTANAESGPLKGGAYLVATLFPVYTCVSATTTAFFVRRFGIYLWTGILTIVRYFVA